MIEVIPIGTNVTLSTDINGTITQICIGSANHVTYQVGWWNGRSRESKWFGEFEITPDDVHPKKIGFRTK